MLLIFLQNTACFSLSKFEFFWALKHPFAAIKVYNIRKKCDKIYDTIALNAKLDKYFSGGKLDAFRHTFYMAAFAQKIKSKKIRALGIAHEKGNYNDFLKGKLEFEELPDSLSGLMDLKNNELGFEIAQNNKTANLLLLKNIVIDYISKGKCYILKRNSNGQFITCNNQVVEQKKIWNTNKCLIKSSEK
ncbi:MAG: hypothetical protein JSU07_02050 [Bacteroidetes bacterium]|nr:hypothetical protein [Bacteroidota bacterium]